MPESDPDSNRVHGALHILNALKDACSLEHKKEIANVLMESASRISQKADYVFTLYQECVFALVDYISTSEAREVGHILLKEVT